MKILVVAAGKGQRFKDVGFKTPKPFIEINGEQMINMVISNIGYIHDSDIYIILLEEHLSLYKQKIPFVRLLNAKDSKYNEIPGSGSAILNATECYNEEWWNDEFLIINCDQIVEYGAISRAVNFFRKKKADAGVVVSYEGRDAKGSHVCIQNGQIVDFSEKSNVAGGDLQDVIDIGCIYYKNGNDFIETLYEMFKDKETSLIHGELCHGPAIRYLLRYSTSKFKCLPFFVNEFINIGLPEEFIKYKNEISKIS